MSDKQLTPIDQIEAELLNAGRRIAEIASENPDHLTRITASKINNEIGALMITIGLAKQMEAEKIGNRDYEQ